MTTRHSIAPNDDMNTHPIHQLKAKLKDLLALLKAFASDPIEARKAFRLPPKYQEQVLNAVFLAPVDQDKSSVSVKTSVASASDSASIPTMPGLPPLSAATSAVESDPQNTHPMTSQSPSRDSSASKTTKAKSRKRQLTQPSLMQMWGKKSRVGPSEPSTTEQQTNKAQESKLAYVKPDGPSKAKGVTVRTWPSKKAKSAKTTTLDKPAEDNITKATPKLLLPGEKRKVVAGDD